MPVSSSHRKLILVATISVLAFANASAVTIQGLSRGTLTISGSLNELPSLGNSVLMGNEVLLLGTGLAGLASWISSISGSGNSVTNGYAQTSASRSVIALLAKSDPAKAAGYLDMMDSGNRDDSVRLAMER